MKRPHYITFGPSIPLVPVGDFSKMSLTEQQWADAWYLCGPSAEQNMRRGGRGRGLELWQVIASAYLEGLNHGAGLEKELHDRSELGGDVQQRIDASTGRQAGRSDDFFNPDAP